MVLYGIKQCDTVRKARRWLDGHGVSYRFHDFRVDGLDESLLQRLEQAVGWEVLLNRRGTTWRTLEESARLDLDREGAIALMLLRPTIIKRPVLEIGERIVVGFTPEDYSQHLQIA